MAVTLREAAAEDAAMMAAIWNPVIRDTTHTFTTIEKSVEGLQADIAARAQAGRPWVIAQVESDIAGFGGFAPFRNGPGYTRCMEYTVMVAETHRGQRIGTAILADIEHRAVGVHATTLIGGVSGENAPALQFHRTHGFDTEICLPGVGHKFGRALDLILFHKFLCSAADIPVKNV